MNKSLKKVLLLLVVITFILFYTFGNSLIKELATMKQGTITIINIDANSKLPIKDTVYFISKSQSEDIIQVLVTDDNGRAESSAFDYGSVYKIKQGKNDAYHAINAEDDFFIEINSDNHKLTIENRMNEFIREFDRTADGDIDVKEVYIPVPTIMQKPELPNGCEITSLTAVLNYYNYEIEKTEMADKYLPKESVYAKNEKLYGPNPYISYAGDPRTVSGLFCYAPPIVQAAKDYFETVGADYNPVDISGSTREEIIDQLRKGNPVVIWVTLELKEPIMDFSWYFSNTGEHFIAPINLHSVVLNGFVEDKVHVMDPLKGQVTYDIDTFFESYNALGSHAMVIYKK